MADITLTVGQNIGGAVKLYDNVTNNEINAVFASTSIDNSNPEFATFSVNPSFTNVINGTGISSGSGTVTITTTVTYTDAGNGVEYTETKTITKTFEVIGSPNGTHLELDMS